MVTQLRLILLVFTLFFFIGCKEEAKPTTSISESTSLKTPQFIADNAFANIEKQLSFGFRVPGTEAHKQMKEWAIVQFESYGAKVITQDFRADFFDEKNVLCTNIMAQLFPEKQKRILLAAHYDSRMVAEKDDERTEDPIPGADDGASGVAVLLEIARLVSESPLGIGVDFILFDAEDQGSSGTSANDWALGSAYWSKNLVPNNYRPAYGILLDMVGSEKATFGKEENSTAIDAKLQDKIWKLAANMGYSDFFRDENYGAVYDDHVPVYQNARIKMIDIINQDPTDRSSFGHYHHTHDDDISIISRRTLKVVGQVVLAVIFNESNGTF